MLKINFEISAENSEKVCEALGYSEDVFSFKPRTQELKSKEEAPEVVEKLAKKGDRKFNVIIEKETEKATLNWEEKVRSPNPESREEFVTRRIEVLLKACLKKSEKEKLEKQIDEVALIS